MRLFKHQGPSGRHVSPKPVLSEATIIQADWPEFTKLIVQIRNKDGSRWLLILSHSELLRLILAIPAFRVTTDLGAVAGATWFKACQKLFTFGEGE